MSSDSNSPGYQHDVDSDEQSSSSEDSALDLDLIGQGINVMPLDIRPRILAATFSPPSLLELCAIFVAKNCPFEIVDNASIYIPDEIRRLIISYSFPANEKDIWIYSCLNVGNCRAFNDGARLWANGSVRHCVQIGFHLNANVGDMGGENPTFYRVSLTFDRGHVTSSTCTCHDKSSKTPLHSILEEDKNWCSHVVATCLQRLRSPDTIEIRDPIAQTLARLSKDELQYFAQNLIRQVGVKRVLPFAQGILDRILTAPDRSLYSLENTRDPTAGGGLAEGAAWGFDTGVLETQLKVVLKTFVQAKTSFYSDIPGLHSDLPPAAEETSVLLRSLRNCDPRECWDLLAVVGNLHQNRDHNAITLLELLTNYTMNCDEIVTWWYVVQLKVPLPSRPHAQIKQFQAYYAAAWFCEAIVDVWRQICLSPELRSGSGRVQRAELVQKLLAWHRKVLQGVQTSMRQMLALRNLVLAPLDPSTTTTTHPPSNAQPRDPAKVYFQPEWRERFIGFIPALEACRISWKEDLAPTASLIPDEFRELLPIFSGATVGPQHAAAVQQVESPSAVALEDLSTLLPDDQAAFYQFNMRDRTSGSIDAFSLDFAHCQGLAASGHLSSAVAWARNLALRLLYQAPSLIATARRLTLSSLRLSVSLGHHRLLANEEQSRQPPPGAAGAAPLSNRKERKLRKYHGNACPPPASQGLFAVVTPSSRRANAPGAPPNLIRRGGPALAARRAADLKETCARLQTKLENSEAVAFAAKLQQLMYRVQYLMDCLFLVHTPPGLSADIQVPALANRRLARCRGNREGDSIPRQPTSGASSNFIAEWLSVDIELSFRLGLLMLSLPRSPMLTAAAEVQLVDLETKLLARMHRLPLETACPWVLKSIREVTDEIGLSSSTWGTTSEVEEGSPTVVGDCLYAHVPYTLAFYLFQLLAGTHPPGTPSAAPNDNQQNPSEVAAPPAEEPGGGGGDDDDDSSSSSSSDASSLGRILNATNYSDSTRAYFAPLTPAGPPTPPLVVRIGGNEASVQVDVLKDSFRAFYMVSTIVRNQTHVPEIVAPVFVECQRSQLRTFVARTMRYYRDDLHRLMRILDALFDRNLNPHFRAPPLHLCMWGSVAEIVGYRYVPRVYDMERRRSLIAQIDTEASETSAAAVTGGGAEPSTSHQPHEHREEQLPTTAPYSSTDPLPANDGASTSQAEQLEPATVAEALPHEDEPSLANGDDTTSDSKAWVERFRCTTLRVPRNHPGDSSSGPETTSSDNSPAFNRRSLPSNQSTPISSTTPDVSFSAAPSVTAAKGGGQAQALSPTRPLPSNRSSSSLLPTVKEDAVTAATCRSPSRPKGVGNGASNVNKGGNGGDDNDDGDVSSFVPPVMHASDNLAHHLFTLAKLMRLIAGGPNARGTVFVAGAFGPPQRNLQTASFYIGLYSLGVSNMANPNGWQTRNYSSYVVWLTNHAYDIGVPAAALLYHTWYNHLNPTELAQLATNLIAPNEHPQLRQIAIELGMLSLLQAPTLKTEDVYRGLRNLESSPANLVRGLLCVEKGSDASPYGLVPDLHFHLARYWYNLYLKARTPSQPSAPPLMRPLSYVTAILQPQPPAPPPVNEAAPQYYIPVQPYYAPPKKGYGVYNTPEMILEDQKMIMLAGYQMDFYARNAYHRPNVPRIPDYLPHFPVRIFNYPPQGADATGHPQYHAPPPAPPSLPPQLVMQHQAPHISPESVGEAPPSAPPPPAAPTVAWNISPETAADESRGVVVAPASNSSGLHGSPVAPPPTENTGGATAFPQDDEVTADPVIPPSEVIDSSSSEDAGAAASSTPTVSEDARTVTDVPVSTRTTAENPGAVGGSASTSRDEESARRLEAAEFLRKAFLSALCAMEKLFPSPTLPNLAPPIITPPPPFRPVALPDAPNTRVRFEYNYHSPWENILDDLAPDLSRARGAAFAFAAHIIWIVELAGMLGTEALEEFCGRAIKCISCPLLMAAITEKVLRTYLTPPATQQQQAWSRQPTASPSSKTLSREVMEQLVDKTHQLFGRTLHQRIRSLGSSAKEWNEYVSFLLAAYRTQHRMPAVNHNLRWEPMLTRLRRLTECSPELWQHILAGIQTVDLEQQPPPNT